MTTPDPSGQNLPPVSRDSATTAPQWRPDENADDQIGRYKLLQKLGEGGCGTVFMAEQEEPVRRRVALKVIKLGMDTKEVIARFEAERQALAMMDHSNIAKVLDAGATETGRPFFVMELVRGIKITDYCDQHHLTTSERLKLFSQVCHAIQHAHQKGIIHRDIKPSNILVTVNDGVAVPKVIDFGIAKATLGRLTDRTVFTAFEQFIGTPAYMSPEQAEMTSLDIDTRSDIYSLGVLLYELLTGHTPFEAKALMQAGLDEMRRHIREVEPPRPSARLSTLEKATLSTAAERRHTDAPKLINLIRGDLDWIVMRCLDKDRTRRYETATSLAQDLQRHLGHEPIVARPVSAAYRFRKLVRRNRLAFAGAGAIAGVLVLGVVVTTWQAIRASRAEGSAKREAERANSEAAIAQAVNDFLVTDLLRQADSREQANDKVAPNPDLKVREALDRAGEKVGARFENQPLTDAAVRSAIGSAYGGVGDYAKAAIHHERALQLRKRILGAEHRDTLMSMNNLASTFLSQGKHTEAAALHVQTLEILKRVLGAEHPGTLTSMNNLAGAYGAQGKHTEAGALHAQTLEISKRVLGAEHPSTLASMHNLAGAYHSQGKYAEAAALHAQTLEIVKRVLGPEHPDTLRSMSNLASAYRFQGKHAEAAALNAQTLEARKRVLGPEHPDTLTSMSNLGTAYHSQGKYAEAAALHAQVWEISKRILGPEHPDTLRSMNNLANAYHSQGKFAEAAALYTQTLEIQKRVLGAEHPGTLTSMSNLASAYHSQGKYAEAAALYAQTLEIQKRVLGPEHPGTLTSMSNLASAYHSQGKYAEAAALHAQTLEIVKRVRGAEHPDTLRSMNNLAGAYQGVGRLAEAVPLFEETLRLRKAKLGPDHANTLTSMSNLAGAYRRVGRLAEVVPLFEETLRLMKAKLGPDHATTIVAMSNLATAYEEANDLPKAETTYRELLAARLRKDGADSTGVSGTRASLGRILLAQHKFADAEPVLREALVIREKKQPNDWQTFNTRSMLGGALAGQKKFADAEPLLLSGYEGMKQREAKIAATAKVRMKEALERLVRFYTDWGQPDKAAEWQKKLDQHNQAEAQKKSAVEPNTK